MAEFSGFGSPESGALQVQWARSIRTGTTISTNPHTHNAARDWH